MMLRSRSLTSYNKKLKKSINKEKIKVTFFFTSYGAENGAIGVRCVFIGGHIQSKEVVHQVSNQF